MIVIIATTWVTACGSSQRHVPRLQPPQRPPGQAQHVTRRVISRSGRVSAATLTPAVAALGAQRSGLPRGSSLRLVPHDWRQTGRFANSIGVLDLPRRRPRRVEVGFMRTRAGWRVTFIEGIA